MPADVFVSYGSADREVARALAALLEERGHSVWWDRYIPPGEDFEKTIEQAIAECRCVLVIWSAQSVDSDWVRAEAIEGLERKILLPVVTDDTQIPLSFRSINRVNLIGWPEIDNPHELDRLLQRVSSLVEPTGADSAAAMPTLPHDKDKMPSVAVMPLISLTSEPDDELLCAGITSEVISSISRLPTFFVIAFSTMWSLRGENLTPRDIARRLDVRYVVQGTMLKAGAQLQIMAEAIDAHSDRQLWSETFRTNYSVDEVFQVQDDMSTAIAGRIQPQLLVAETNRSLSQPPEYLQAWELVNRARQAHVSREKSKEVRRLLERAVELDPNYGEAYAMLARVLSFRAIIHGPRFAADAREVIDKAIRVAPNHDLTLMSAGVACVNIAEYDEALFYCNRAVELNPNLAQAWAYLGLATLGATKDGRTALEQLDRAFELSPEDEDLYLWYHLKAPCYAELDDYEMAQEMSRRSVQLYRDWFFSWMCHAQYLAVLGRTAEAEHAWQEARTRFPGLNRELYYESVRNYAQLSDHHKNKLIAAVSKLGVE